MKPALLLDVDGVINAYPQQRNPRPPYVVHDNINGYKITAHPHWSNWLRELTAPEGPFELVWATTWEDLAPVHIAPLFDLPTEGVEVVQGFGALGYKYPGPTHKLPAMIRWWEANPDRPSVWIDDCIYQDAAAYMNERDKTVPTKFVQTYPDLGLTIDNVIEVWNFAHSYGWMLGQDGERL